MAVVAIHNWSLLHVLEVGTARWWAVDIALNASRWAVPVFVLISGGLLLGPRRDEAPSAFYRRRLVRVGVPALFWIVAYLVFRGTFLKQDLTAQSVATDLVMARPFVHLYFLYLILGLYLVTPFIRPFTAAASRTQLTLAAAGLLAVWAIETILPRAVGVGSRITGLTYWIPYLGFYVAGRALYGLRLSRTAAVLMALAVVVLITGQVLSVYLLTWVGDGSWRTYPQSYFSIFTIGSALLIYALCAQDTAGQWRSDRLARVAATLGAATFGVFLVHEMLLHWHARTFVSGTPAELVTLRIPTYVVGLLGSFAIVLAARRVRGLRAIF